MSETTRELIMAAAGIKPVELPTGCFIVPVAPKPEPEPKQELGE